MEKGVNPWTGKSKIPKNTGLYNEILFKYYPQLQRPQPKNEYLEMITIIESERTIKDIEQYRDLFELNSKITKMNEIIDWIDKIETMQSKVQRESETPIDSSFVYIPVHAYNTFHQLLKDCIGGTKEPLLKEESLQYLKNELGNLEQVLQFNELIMKNIL